MLKRKNFIKVYKVFSITLNYLKLAYKPSANVDILKDLWSREIVSLFNLKIIVLGNPANDPLTPYLLVGNHISYLDIPVLLNSFPQISFVSKSEVKSWPVIGRAAIKGKTIFVERNSNQSRANAKTQIAESLIENRRKVVIFPSGTTSIKTSSFWKKGAFEIAEKNKIMLQPFRLKYKPLRAVAFVGKDNLLAHMYQLFKYAKVEVTLEFHEPVLITDSVNDCNFWKSWCEH